MGEISLNEYILEMNNVTKEFPGVKALDNVSFKVKILSFIMWRKRSW